MSSSDRTASWRTANMGSSSTHASTRQPQQPLRPSTPPLSKSFYNNSNNPLVTGAATIPKTSNNNVSRSKSNGGGVVDIPVRKKCVLRPLAVRERSKSIQGCQELKSKDITSTIVSFLIIPQPEESKMQEKENSNSNSTNNNNNKLPIRVNVFCDTGTVGTAKVMGGAVRQSFRRNVTSLDVLERLLRNPEGPVEINDQLIGVTDTDEDEQDLESDSQTGAAAAAVPNYKKGVELADVGLCILEGEREKLAKHLRHLDEELYDEVTEKRKAEETQHQQHQQQQQEQRIKQEDPKQKQQQATKRQESPKPEDQHSGDMQADMLTKAMTNSQQDGGGNGGGNRIGRRRNKLSNLRKKRDANNKGILSNSTHVMHRNKRRGGKQTAVAVAAADTHTANGTPAAEPDRSDSKPKKSSRTGRLAAKISTLTGSPGGPTQPSNNNKNNPSNHHDGSDSGSASSLLSSSEYNKRVASANANANANINHNTNINSFKQCGYEFHFKLPAEVMNQVDQCLRDIAKMNKVVKGVATNGRGTVFLYGNGGVAYTPSIPKALYQKLRQLRSSSFSSRPCFVALGTRDRYFVSFNDGTGDWKGSNSLDKILKKRVLKNTSGLITKRSSGSNDNPATMVPRSVAFGATYDTFFVVFGDGSWEYQGRSIPKSLEKKLRERDDAADLVLCNLGANGEWFMKAESGKMWWSGISPELDLVLKKITKKGYLHNMDFGENGSYFVSYDEE